MIATAMIAPSKNPAPIASPRQADAQSPAAVVRPLTWLSFVTRIVPAPRKPMPLITCAPKRDTSVVIPTLPAIVAHWVVTIMYSYWESSIVSAAPTETII